MRGDRVSLLDKLSDKGCWEEFYEYKRSLCGSKAFVNRLRAFIDTAGYMPVVERIKCGVPFPLPKKSIVSKLGKEKKREVYTYPEAENTVLKLLTYLMLRKYDGLFSHGLYSFRPSRNARDAVKLLTRRRGIDSLYAAKLDISNYFNSVPVEGLLPILEAALDDGELYEFLKSLLCEPGAIFEGRVVTPQKGIMAGTPVSAFLANLYLAGLDERFADMEVLYARYSDDCIAFAPTREEAEGYLDMIKAYLDKMGLCVNPDKERLYAPGERWEFLGFSYQQGAVDISEVSLKKLKKKMKRKAGSLIRWAQRERLPREKAAKAFIRIFNAKLFENSGAGELTWSRWYFPMINTDRSLKALDAYAQECLRYILSGKRTKARFNVRYEYLKRLGLRSLVNEYYKVKLDKNARQTAKQ